MEKNEQKQKILRLVKIIILALLTGFFIFFLWSLIDVAELEHSRTAPGLWPRSLEASRLFWFFCCWIALHSMLTALCIVKLIRLLLNRTEKKPVFPAKARKILFITAFVILAILLVFCFYYGKICKESFAAMNDWAVYDAERYYPFVIGVELDLGFIVWMLADMMRERKLRKKMLAANTAKEGKD